MRRRDQLKDLAERLRVVQNESGLIFSTHSEIVEELERAESELAQLQDELVNPSEKGVSGS